MHCNLNANTTKHMKCSYLLRKTPDNRCVLFVNKLSNNSIEINLKNILGQCQKPKKNASDATNSDAQKDETHFQEQRIFCDYSYQIPSGSEHSNCYNITDICVYRLNTCHQLIPCGYGQHLQDYKGFECNMMFKRPKFYCIQ